MVALEAVRHLTVVALVVVGTFFLATGTVGLLRFPNVYNRMHATSKPTTLGTAATFLAGFVHFGPGGSGLTSLVGILFLFLTVPTGAHMISRAAQKTGVPFLGSVTWPSEGETEGEDGDGGGGSGDDEGEEGDNGSGDGDADGGSGESEGADGDGDDRTGTPR